jgi:hypothetical protein
MTPVLLLAEIWDSDQLRPLRDRPSAFLVLGVFGVAVVAQHAGRERQRSREVLPDEGTKGVSIALAGQLDERAFSRRGVGWV